MKKISIILIAIILLYNCEEYTEREMHIENYNSIKWKIITIEGCEFYIGDDKAGAGYMSKVDCDCHPNNTK